MAILTNNENNDDQQYEQYQGLFLAVLCLSVLVRGWYISHGRTFFSFNQTIVHNSFYM